MNIFITGGLGYIGSKLTLSLEAKGHNVTILDAGWFGNHLPHNSSRRVIKEDLRLFSEPLNGFDIVIHLANIANDPGVELNQMLSWDVNVLATYQLLEKAIRDKVTVFIYASSGSVYGVSQKEKVDELTDLFPMSAYNKTKMIAERVLLSSTDRIKVFNIRPATVCGFSPRMRLDLAVNMLTFQALSRSEITVLGGDQFRPNIHIDDLVRTYVHFVDHHESITSGNFNAGFENLTIRQIAEIISAEIPSRVIYKESNDDRSYRLDSSKLIKTGFMPQKGIRDAILELKMKFESGELKESSQWMTVETMKRLGLK